MPEAQGVIVASNRLPVVLRRDGEDEFAVEPGNGGLVTALTPVLRGRKSSWVGWTGGTDPLTRRLEDTLKATGERMGLRLCPLLLTQEEVRGYYRGFSSEILWPLFHDLATNCRFDPAYWVSYSHVNRKLARLVARSANEHDIVWIHDYHFLTAATELRRLGTRNLLGFFLHVPFPPPDTFARLPWRRQVLEGLLDFDVVGFQSDDDAENFLRCVEAFVPDHGGGKSPFDVSGKRNVGSGYGNPRGVAIGGFPIGIDYSEFEEMAASDEVSGIAAKLKEHYAGQEILLGVDRLDYTKGLPHKLRGYRLALERYPELRRRVTLVQYVVPSRESIPAYRELRPEIERLVGEINGQFGTPSWVPVRYFYQTLPREELCAYYRLATVLLVTSLKDGMNLVAKEYCACNVSENGVLVLSEFAGAASQLGRDALLVNPHDVEAMARAIHTGVFMPAPERRRRMSALRHNVAQNDVYQWVDDFFETLVEHSKPEPTRSEGYSVAMSLLSK